MSLARSCLYLDRRSRNPKHELFDAYYDGFLARSLCESYKESKDPTTLNALLAQTAPLIGMVARVRIGSVTCDYDTARTEAFERLFFCFTQQNVPTRSVRVFTTFLYIIIYRAMIDSIRRSSPQVFDCWKKCSEPLYGKVSSHYDMDMVIHYRELRDLIRKLSDDEIRYSGREREACKYIISCLLGYVKLDPLSVKFKFRLSESRSKQLVQYCDILVKRVAYDVKEIADEDS